MNDAAIIQGEGFMDLSLLNGDIVGEEGLETSVLISVFSDMRVPEEELPAEQSSRRGWWGDLFSEADQDKHGSNLWTLEREKRTEKVRKSYETGLKNCLQWMIEDGIAQSVSVVSSYNDRGHLVNVVEITRPDGGKESFSFIWDGQELKRG